jgi:hypothetical protein
VSVGFVRVGFVEESKARCFVGQVFSLADGVRPDIGILDGNIWTPDLVLRKVA